MEDEADLCLPHHIWGHFVVSLAPVSGEGVLAVGHRGHHRRAVLVDEESPLRIPAACAG